MMSAVSDSRGCASGSRPAALRAIGLALACAMGVASLTAQAAQVAGGTIGQATKVTTPPKAASAAQAPAASVKRAASAAH